LPNQEVFFRVSLVAWRVSANAQVSETDGEIEGLREQNALLIQRLFGCKSEQTTDPDSPQLAMFNEAESLAEVAPEVPAAEAQEEVVAPTKRRSKRKPLPAKLPRVEIVHELPEQKLTCEFGSPQAGNRRAAAGHAQPEARYVARQPGDSLRRNPSASIERVGTRAEQSIQDVGANRWPTR